MMKQLAESRETLQALYKKYKMGPNDFKNVITPPQTLPLGVGPASNGVLLRAKVISVE